VKINLTETLLAAFIILISIFTFKPAYDYTTVRLLIADIFVFLCALHFFARRRPFSTPLPVLISLTGFVLFVTISAACSVFPAATVRELPHFLTYVLLFLVAGQIYPTSFVIGSWIAAVIILSFTGLYDYSQSLMVVTPLGNKNFFAGYLILIIPLTISLLWQQILALRAARSGAGSKPSLAAKRRLPRQPDDYRPLILIITLALTVILFFALLILANSLSAFIGLAGGVLFLTGLFLGKFRVFRFNRLFILSVLIAVLALTVAVGIKKGASHALSNVRYPLWKGSADMIMQKPVTGFGPGTFLAVFQRFRPASYYNRQEAAPLSDHSHNEYLELASESGLPALFFFLTFLASVLALSVRKIKNAGGIANPPKAGMTIPPEWFLLAGLVSGLIAILIDGLSSTNLRTFSVAPAFYLLLGFCAAIISADKTAERKPDSRNTKPKKDLKIAPVSFSGFQTSFVWIAVMVFNVFSAGFIAREIKGQVYYKEGITERNAQNWPGAISQYQKALEIDPANLQAAYKLGFIYANVNRTEDAINLYRDILRISPNFAKTYYNLALLSLKLNDKNSAVIYLNLLLRYDPYDTEAQKILNILTANPAVKIPVPQN
jgi:O-antigen ligase